MTDETLENPIFCKSCKRTLADHSKLELILCAIRLTDVVQKGYE